MLICGDKEQEDPDHGEWSGDCSPQPRNWQTPRRVDATAATNHSFRPSRREIWGNLSSRIGSIASRAHSDLPVYDVIRD